MCEVCGCGDTRRVSVEVHASLMQDNDARAAHLREHFREDGVLALNVMGSPGSGKTALIEATARELSGRLRLAAVSADLATALDAERLARAGVFSAAITTGSACHLDAAMVHHALHDQALARAVHAADVFFIENVGNLVCPAIYDLGQTANVVLLSVTEGVDKPLKYPLMFHKADLVVVTKLDLVPYLGDVSLPVLRQNLARVTPSAAVLELSATTRQGVPEFVRWLEQRRAGLPSREHPQEHGHQHEHGVSG
jgi:hydrogenase nickel incorporation protein HypB